MMGSLQWSLELFVQCWSWAVFDSSQNPQTWLHYRGRGSTSVFLWNAATVRLPRQHGWQHKQRGQRWEVESSSKSVLNLALKSLAYSWFCNRKMPLLWCLLVQEMHPLPFFDDFWRGLFIGNEMHNYLQCDVISHQAFVKLNLPLCGPAYGSAVPALI